SPDAAAAARKVVTIVFADLIGSTSLHERLDPESVGRLMDRYYRALRAPVEAYGGTVVQLLGDGVMCAFGVPHVAEDDAIRLVRDLVTLAPFGVFSLKGRSETVAAYRVVSLDRPAGAPATAFVGREDELRRIMAVYDAAVAARRARLAVILGSPGLGKSRLITELARRLGERATLVTARCDAAGGATFAPLAEALRAALHIDAGASGDGLRAAIEAVVPGDESERARIGGGITPLLAGTPASPEETFFVVRRLLAGLATAQPVVLAIDDLQWAEPLLLD